MKTFAVDPATTRRALIVGTLTLAAAGLMSFQARPAAMRT